MRRVHGNGRMRRDGHRPRHPRAGRRAGAFTLLEVMIASGILFTCLFAILAVLSGALRNARALQHRTVDPGMRAAELVLTNRMTEGTDSGDFGDLYPDYRWHQEAYSVGSNGLWQVDLTVTKRYGERAEESRMSILLYSPDSQAGSAFGLGVPGR